MIRKSLSLAKNMKTTKVLVSSHPNSQHTSFLKSEFAKIGTAEFEFGHRPEDFSAEFINNAEVLLLNPFGFIGKPLYNELFPKIKNLKWVHSLAAGVDSFVKDLNDFNEDIPLTNAKHAYSSSLAEYCLACILYFNKQFPRLLENKNNKIWDQFTMQEIKNKKIGFVGWGSIAKSTAKLCYAFDVEILVNKRNLDILPKLMDKSGKVEIDYRVVDKETIFREADYIIVTLPSTSDTFHFCDDTAFKSMKQNSSFISIGRGCCVDETALIQHASKLNGIALDVFETEPLPKTSKLWELNNVFISSHNADITESYVESTIKVFQDRFEEYTAGKDFSEVVDKNAGY